MIREIDVRKKLVNTAMTFAGYTEAAGQDDIIIKMYNNIRPKGGYEMNMNDAWCAAYASVVGNVAGMSSIIPIECSCERMIEKFKEMGRWEEDGTKIPVIGDYIFYNWDDGTQPNDGWSDHVGIVVSITARTAKVIEGNYNNAVQYRTINIGWGYIRGYGKPDYAKLADVDDNTANYALGDVVDFTGTKHYSNSYESGVEAKCGPGKAKITAISMGNAHPYHLVAVDGSSVYGWVDASDIGKKTTVSNMSKIRKGDRVKVLKNVTYSGLKFKTYFNVYEVIEVSGNRAVIGIGNTITCAIHVDNIQKV